MISYSDLLLVGATSVATSALTWWALFAGSRKSVSAQRRAKTTKDHPSFLFLDDRLIDCSPTAEDLLEASNATIVDWSDLHAMVSPRFPTFPASPPTERIELPALFDSSDHGPLSRLTIAAKGQHLRVQLSETLDAGQSIPALFKQRNLTHETDTLKSAVDHAPFPIWQTDPSGHITWANHAYSDLARKVIGDAAPSGAPSDRWPKLFPAPSSAAEKAQDRIALTPKNGEGTLWYDQTTITEGDRTLHYATDVNAVVHGELAQRNFVQSLTKTFSELSIGLAIFDRNRTLTTFNPALTDLTTLPASFLSNRPDLVSFFDQLREARMIPEPKNYKEWRAKLIGLSSDEAASQYLEIWNLPSGLTYRVSARPHPDGALAFLFEDISAEVSLTRRFRAELELNHAVLDRLDGPVAVFSDSGTLHFCNQAYGSLWAVETNTGFTEVTFMDSVRLWQDRADIEQNPEDLLLQVAKQGPEAITGSTFILPDGSRRIATAQRIMGRATLVHFAKPGEARPILALAHSA